MSTEKVRPKVGVAVYITNEKGEILLLLRKGGHAAGVWGAPGGHLENQESFLDCAKREIKEEVNSEVGDIEVLGVVNNIFNSEKHYVNVDVWAKDITGEVKNLEPEKCEKLGWFSLNNLPSPIIITLPNLLAAYPDVKNKLSNSNSFRTNA